MIGNYIGTPIGGLISEDVISDAVATADGHATASAGGASVSAQPGIATADATAASVGAPYFDGAGAADGHATAAAVGDGKTSLVGSADCDATATAISTFGVQGDAAGSATCIGIGDYRLRTVKVISTDLGGRIRTITIAPPAAIASASQPRSATAFGVTSGIASAAQPRAKTTVC